MALAACPQTLMAMGRAVLAPVAQWNENTAAERERMGPRLERMDHQRHRVADIATQMAATQTDEILSDDALRGTDASSRRNVGRPLLPPQFTRQTPSSTTLQQKSGGVFTVCDARFDFTDAKGAVSDGTTSTPIGS